MLPLFLLLLGILSLLLLQSFSIYRSAITMVILGIVLGFTVLQESLFIVSMQSISILITIWVVYIFDDENEPFSILLLFSLLGGMVSIQAQHWLTLYMGLELMALPLYALSAMNQNEVLSKEAALKYFVMGAIASLLILYGISFIYMATGSLIWGNYQVVLVDYYHIGWVLVWTGMLIKLGLVPFHSWVPDIYQTVPLGILAWLSMVPKVVYLSVLIQMLHLEQLSFLSQIIQSIAGLSMIYGAVLAIMQSNIRRLMAYASIVHMGIMVLPLMFYQMGYHASLFYLMVYLVMSLKLFICLHILESLGIEDIQSLKSLGYQKRYEAGLFLITLISMAGIPPLVGFIAKLNILYLLVQKMAYITAIVMIVAAMISGYYYMNMVRLMYTKGESNQGTTSWMIMIYAIPIIVLSIIPSQFLVWLDMVIKGI